MKRHARVNDNPSSGERAELDEKSEQYTTADDTVPIKLKKRSAHKTAAVSEDAQEESTTDNRRVRLSNNHADTAATLGNNSRSNGGLQEDYDEFDELMNDGDDAGEY